MVNVIMGLKGSGKTKRLISLVRQAAVEESGDVVCIENRAELMFDIPHSVRLVCTSDYDFRSYEYLKGFISGLHAGNYDITHIFIENLNKIFNAQNMDETEEFLCWCDSFSDRENVKFTITISEDENKATDKMKEFMI